MDALPVEIWLSVFTFVSSSGIHVSLPRYAPFVPSFNSMETRDWPQRGHIYPRSIGLSTLASVVLVCKQWNVWATPILYSTLRIHHGTHGLCDALKLGHKANYVRRIDVHHDPIDFTPFNAILLVDILRQCSKTLTTFVRPWLSKAGGALLRLHDYQSSPADVSFPLLPALTCIEWYNAGARVDHYDIPNFLVCLIACSPSLVSLRYSHGEIFVPTPPRPSRLPLGIPTHPSLPLQILILENVSNSMCLFRLDLPSLHTLVISQPHHIPPLPRTSLDQHNEHETNPTISAHSKQIKTLEFSPLFATHLSSPKTSQRILGGGGGLFKTFENVVELLMPLNVLVGFSERFWEGHHGGDDGGQGGIGSTTGMTHGGLGRLRILRVNYSHASECYAPAIHLAWFLDRVLFPLSLFPSYSSSSDSTTTSQKIVLHTAQAGGSTTATNSEQTWSTDGSTDSPGLGVYALYVFQTFVESRQNLDLARNYPDLDLEFA